MSGWGKVSSFSSLSTSHRLPCPLTTLSHPLSTCLVSLSNFPKFLEFNMAVRHFVKKHWNQTFARWKCTCWLDMMRDAWLNLIVNSLSVELQELTAKEHDTSGNFTAFNFTPKCKLCEQKKGIEKANWSIRVCYLGTTPSSLNWLTKNCKVHKAAGKGNYKLVLEISFL